MPEAKSAMRVERVGAELGTAEQVVDLVALGVDAALDRVVTGVIGAGEEEGGLLGVDLVVVAVLLLAQVHRRRTVAGNRHRHLRLLVGHVGVLHEVLVADLGLGGEVVRPVVVELQRDVVGLDRLGIGVAAQADRVRRVAERCRMRLLGLVVGQADAVVVGDVPVDLGQVALVFQRHPAGAAEGARLQAQLVGDVDDLLHVARRELVGGRRAVAEAGVQTVGRIGADAGDLLLLGGHEEEQLVLDDRTAQREAAGGVLVEAVVVCSPDCWSPASRRCRPACWRSGRRNRPSRGTRWCRTWSPR